jgi:uncharacterized membrane protein YedE/YeeE
MTRRRIAGGLVGIAFGVILSWSGMTSPDVIRGALLFHSFYLYGFFASALATAFIGQRLLRGAGARAVLTGEKIAWSPERPERRHVVGSVMFGIGWGVADVCPGPLATQLGQGVGWSVFTLTGVIASVVVFERRRRAGQTIVGTVPPSTDHAAPATVLALAEHRNTITSATS